MTGNEFVKTLRVCSVPSLLHHGHARVDPISGFFTDPSIRSSGYLVEHQRFI